MQALLHECASQLERNHRPRDHLLALTFNTPGFDQVSLSVGGEKVLEDPFRCLITDALSVEEFQVSPSLLRPARLIISLEVLFPRFFGRGIRRHSLETQSLVK